MGVITDQNDLFLQGDGEHCLGEHFETDGLEQLFDAIVLEGAEFMVVLGETDHLAIEQFDEEFTVLPPFLQQGDQEGHIEL